MKRLNKYEIEIERTGGMKLAATIFASREIPLEPDAVRQLCDAAMLPGLTRVLATPDIHVGYGVPIGSVLAGNNIIIPAAVGYDINCGMRLYTTRMPAAELDAGLLAERIAERVPLGPGKQNIRLSRDNFAMILENGVSGLVHLASNKSGAALGGRVDPKQVRADTERIEDGGSLAGEPGVCSDHALARGMAQLGTLGGGNHFVEIQIVDSIYDEQLARQFGLEKGAVALMIHTGSRGFGHQVGDDYMKLALKVNKSRNLDRPNNNLCRLELSSKEGRNYLGAMNAAANFAFANRQLIGSFVQEAWQSSGLPGLPQLLYDVPHNMAKYERHGGKNLLLHRKGATRAFGGSRMKGTPFEATGQPVLIPGSMGTASYVLAGVDDNDKSLASVNHGAGRVLSRSAARGKKGKGKKKGTPAAISDAQFERSMAGVKLICNSRRSAREEAPAAYKDIDAVIDTVAGAGLARVVARLKPLAVLKG
jgi:tRNA-splicing ligase RtcB (3'-phosphate/5'-hydroxy nucleic acid ligase)